MKTVFIILAGLFLSIAFAFIPPKHSIVGHWILNEHAGSKTYLDFKSNGTFETRYNGKLDHYGNYKFIDLVLSITDKDKEGCGIGYWGKYNLTFIGKDSITFTVVEDSCTGRRDDLSSGLVRSRK